MTVDKTGLLNAVQGSPSDAASFVASCLREKCAEGEGWMDSFKKFGNTLMADPSAAAGQAWDVMKNPAYGSAIGAGVGALGGALTAPRKRRISGALMGALMGGGLGAMPAAGSYLYENAGRMRPSSLIEKELAGGGTAGSLLNQVGQTAARLGAVAAVHPISTGLGVTGAINSIRRQKAESDYGALRAGLELRSKKDSPFDPIMASSQLDALGGKFNSALADRQKPGSVELFGRKLNIPAPIKNFFSSSPEQQALSHAKDFFNNGTTPGSTWPGPSLNKTSPLMTPTQFEDALRVGRKETAPKSVPGFAAKYGRGAGRALGGGLAGAGVGWLVDTALSPLTHPALRSASKTMQSYGY